MILLTDKEMEQIERDTGLVGQYIDTNDLEIDEAIAKAQLRKVVEFINEVSRENGVWGGFSYADFKVLLKEIE